MEQSMHNISTPPIIQNVSRLETIAEEELTYPDLSEESLAEDVPKSSNNKDVSDSQMNILKNCKKL